MNIFKKAISFFLASIITFGTLLIPISAIDFSKEPPATSENTENEDSETISSANAPKGYRAKNVFLHNCMCLIKCKICYVYCITSFVPPVFWKKVTWMVLFLSKRVLLRISTVPNCPMGVSSLAHSFSAVKILVSTRSGTL